MMYLRTGSPPDPQWPITSVDSARQVVQEEQPGMHESIRV